ncbi:DUF4097 domain-containing protein [Chloroflexi bacterium CFX2]|jgi:hypothetical protein|nr:DUF4097 family beta strand repeat protein [Anaerolineales bacterium]MBV6468092.1 hypothetical protein [Anaerolineales bacterium]MDL1944777.1 DUF4097 domain-containing protein [Chloroflexi bacterium CFX2]
MKRSLVIALLIVALVFVLAGIGTVLFFTFDRGGRGFVFDQSLVSATAEESKTLNVEGRVTLKVQDDAGNVSIVGGEGETVEVKIVKTSNALTQARAAEDLKNIRYQIEQDGNVVTLTYDLSRINTRDVDTVDFIITVPNEVIVDVNAGMGEVNVSGTNGNVIIFNDFGDVIVENIEGTVNVETKGGRVDASSINAGDGSIDLSSGFGKVSLEKATGKDIKLYSNSGLLEMNDVRASGDIEMSTDFGDIFFNNGSSNLLTVETKGGKVSLGQLNLRGALTVQNNFGEIELEQAKATSYDLQAGSGSVTVDGAQGKLKATSDFGSIIIKNAENVTVDLDTKSGSVDFEGSLGDGPHNIHSSFGEIHITVPADSALNVDLKTGFGSIESEIPITVTLTDTTKGSQQTGTMNNGGNQLTVETENGSISIEASK